MRLALIQPPIWGNLRTPWEIAYVKSYVETFSSDEVHTIDMGPMCLPLVETFGHNIQEAVGDDFETECFLSSLAFITAIADMYLVRLFYDEADESFYKAVRALLKTKTHHAGDDLEKLTHAFINDPFWKQLDEKIEDVCLGISSEKFDYAGCTTHITSYAIGLYILQRLKVIDPNIITVLSGYQASMVPYETIFSCEWVDLVIRGESEGGYFEILARQLKGKQVIDKKASPLNMDQMPPPDYRDLDITQYKQVSLMASRNCPHGKCKFCQEEAFWSVFRFRDPAKLVNDMEVLYERHGTKRFDFVDLDIRDFVEDLGRILSERNHSFTWSGAMRADNRTPALLSRMKNTSCKTIFFGFETASHRLLHMMQKNITPATLERTLAAAKEVGIGAKLTCIAGLPTETRADIELTKEFVAKNAAAIRIVLVQCFKLLNKSPIAEACSVEGNAFGLKVYSIPELSKVHHLMYALPYEGQPSPPEAIGRFIELRRHFREINVDERAVLLSSNKKHKKQLLGLR